MNTMNVNLLRSRGTLALLAGIGLLLPAAQVMADDDAYPLAPPVDTYSAPAAVTNVFNWQDVPQNQVVPIERAVFDQGGYQLYDTQGETIVVPFQNDNLYVMKFAVSQTGQTYFVNDAGQAPVLYIPQGAYLENATVPGARWYPFSQQFCPAQPVFLGIAPSYSEFISIGWYPDEICRGGFYGSVSFVDGGFFEPTIGLTFLFGGHHFDGWDGYREYAQNYPAPYRVGYFHRNYYQVAGRPDYNRSFNFSGGSGRTAYPSGSNFGGRGQGFGASRPAFNGTGRTSGNQSDYPFMNRPTFGGTTASRPTFQGTTTRPGFGGATASRPTFNGATASRPSFGGAATDRPVFNGGTSRPTFGDATASRPSFNGVRQSPSYSNSGPTQRTFQGVSGNTGARSFGNQGSSPVFGGSQSRSSFGGQNFAGASRPAFQGAPPSRGNGSTQNAPAQRGNDNSSNSSASRSSTNFNDDRGFGR